MGGVGGGGIEGREKRGCSKQLALNGIDGRDGYNRSGEPVPIFYDAY